MINNAILFSKVARKDGWVSNGLVFKVNNTNTYEDSYNEIKDKIETPEIIEYIKHRIELHTPENLTFKKTYWYFGSLYFKFETEDEVEYEYKLTADYVYLSN
jgi:hypothetical protein